MGVTVNPLPPAIRVQNRHPNEEGHMRYQKSRLRTIRSIALAAGLFLFFAGLVAGCASTGAKSSGSQPAATQPIENAGFLSDYDRLEKAAENSNARSWRNPDIDWKKYDKILIERMKVMLKPESQRKGD